MTKPSFITNCYLLSRVQVIGPEDALFFFGEEPVISLDHYAVIPMEVFTAMGGVEHKAVQEYADEGKRKMMAEYAKTLPQKIAEEFVLHHCKDN